MSALGQTQTFAAAHQVMSAKGRKRMSKIPVCQRLSAEQESNEISPSDALFIDIPPSQLTQRFDRTIVRFSEALRHFRVECRSIKQRIIWTI